MSRDLSTGRAWSFFVATMVVCGATADAGLMLEDFTDGHFDETVWTISVPAPAEGRAALEPDGLHITVPARPAGKGTVNIKSRIPLKGDFTMTMVYTLKSLGTPTTGFTNCQLLASNSTDGAMAALRQAVDKQGHGFSLWHEPPKGMTDPKGGWLFKPATSTDESRGALRLRRKGSTVDVSYRLAEGDVFVPVGEFEYGKAAIENWEFLVLSPYETTSPTELYIHSIDVDVEGLDVPETVRRTPKSPSMLPSIILFGSAGLVVVVVAFALLRSRKKTPATKARA